MLTEMQKRRKRLLEEIAIAVKYDVAVPHSGGYYKFKVVAECSEWLRETYDLGEVVNRKESILFQDLCEISRKGWIGFSSQTDRRRNKVGEHEYDSDPLYWTVGLKDDGLQVVEDSMKSWWSKAIDKQPITFVQIIVTVALALAGVVGTLGGYLVGRSQATPAAPASQPVATAVQPSPTTTTPPVLPTSQPTTQP